MRVTGHPQLNGKQHQVGKPESLMEKLVAIVKPNSTVLDPFIG